MALEYVGGASGSGASADYTISLTALTGGIGTSPQAGDVVVVVTGFSQGSDLNPGPTTAGYVEVADLYVNDNYDANLSVAYKVMGATPDTSVTVAGSGSSYGAATVVHVWRGVEPTTPLDVAVTTATGIDSGTIDSPAITPITAGAVVLTCGLAAQSSTSAKTAPSGYGNAVQVFVDPSRAALAVIASKAWTSGAEDPGAWTGGSSGTSDSWAAVTLALRPAAGVGGVTATASITDAPDAVAATGAIWVTASAGATDAADSVSAATAVRIVAAAALTDAADTLAATFGSLTPITASAAITDAPDAVAASTTVRVTAGLSITDAADTVAATAAARITAALAATDAPDGLSATASVRVVVAAVLTDDGDVLTAHVGTSSAWSASLTDAPDTLASLASVRVAASAALADAPDTVNAAATLAVLAALSVVDAPDTLSSHVSNATGWQLAVTDAPDTMVSVATVSVAVQGAVTDGDDTLSATSVVRIAAVAFITDGDDTLIAALAGAGPTSPTFDYQPMADSATRMLKRFGAAATLQRQTSTSYDPATSLGGVTETLMPTTAVVVSYQQDYVDGSLILQGDRRALCDPAVEPLTGDRFAWQGKEYTVVGVTPVAPAGIALLFEAQIRG